MATQDIIANRIFAEAHFELVATLDTGCNMPYGRSLIYALALEPVMRQSQCVEKGGRG